MKKILILLLIFCTCSCQKTNAPNTMLPSKLDDKTIVNSANINPDVNNIPELVRAHFKQGSYFLTKGDYENAIRKLKLAIKLKEDFVQAHYNLGVAYYETNKTGLAIEEWNTTIELDPDYTKAYLSLGFAYEKLSDNEKAVENYDKYLQLNPEDPRAKILSKKINDLRGQIVVHGIIGKILLADKITSQPQLITEPKDTFSDKVTQIYANLEIGDAPQNTNIKIICYYLGLKGEEILVNSAEKIVTGPQNIIFELNKPTKAPWPPGRYEIRIYVNGKENMSVPLTILKEETTQNAKGKNS